MTARPDPYAEALEVWGRNNITFCGRWSDEDKATMRDFIAGYIRKATTMTAVDLYDKKLYYRVKHPEFSEGYIYRALHHVLPASETGWSYLTFINERGMTYTVRVDRTHCINVQYGVPCGATGLAFDLSHDERIRNLPWPKPTRYNPDLDTDF